MLSSCIVLILIRLSAILVIQLVWKSLLEGIVVRIVDLRFSDHSTGLVVSAHFLLRPVVEGIGHVVVVGC